MTVGITIPTDEFDRWMANYIKVSSKTASDAFKQRCFFVVKGALKATKQADKAAIEQELGRERVNKIGKKGQVLKSTRFAYKIGARVKYKGKSVKLVWLLVNARRRAKGLRGATNAEMDYGVAELIKKRTSHVSYLKAGWIPALKKFDKYAAAGITVEGKFKRAPGTAVWKDDPWRPKAVIINYAHGVAGTGKEMTGLIKYAAPALQASMAAEAKNMETEIAKRMAAA